MRPRVAPHEESGSCRGDSGGDDWKSPADDSRKGAPCGTPLAVTIGNARHLRADRPQ